MRKNVLIEEMNKVIAKNARLFERCTQLQKMLDEKQSQIEELNCENLNLREENEKLKSELEREDTVSAEPIVCSESADVNAQTDASDNTRDNVSDDFDDVVVSDITVKSDAEEESLTEVNEVKSETHSENETVKANFFEGAVCKALPTNGALDIASAAIGRVVLKCAAVCNEFTVNGNVNAKDLVNLALGRTEVFKSEVLGLVSDDLSIEMLTAEINAKEVAALEYFELLINQL